MFTSRANYTKWKSGAHLNTIFQTTYFCWHVAIFSSKHDGSKLNHQTGSILKQSFHFPRKEEMPSGCGESEDTRKNTAAMVLLSKTMTDYLNYVTQFIGQAIISAVVQYLPQACSINSVSALKTKLVLMQLSCLVKAPGLNKRGLSTAEHYRRGLQNQIHSLKWQNI